MIRTTAIVSFFFMLCIVRLFRVLSYVIHYDILDKARLEILPLFNFTVEEGFYLAGGTGLALQVGHRDSVDFDFFKEGDFDVDSLIGVLENIFLEQSFVVVQKEKKHSVFCLGR